MATPPQIAPPGSLRLKLWNAITRVNVLAFRLTKGRVGGKVSGTPVLLLDHVGRKSGQRRTTPLHYLEDGDDLVVVASRAGSDVTPAWWLNLKANASTTVQVGDERRRVRAREASADETAALWPRLVEMYPPYDEYTRRTERRIPVIILEPGE